MRKVLAWLGVRAGTHAIYIHGIVVRIFQGDDAIKKKIMAKVLVRRGLRRRHASVAAMARCSQGHWGPNGAAENIVATDEHCG